jgi:hypothetical protein
MDGHDRHRLRVVLRGLGVVLLATQGAIHLWQWFEGFSDIAVIGPLFLVAAVAAFVLAIGLLATSHVLVPAAGVLLALGQIVGLVLASTLGLFGFEAELNWTGPEGAALSSELLTIVVLGALARLRRR